MIISIVSQGVEEGDGDLGTRTCWYLHVSTISSLKWELEPTAKRTPSPVAVAEVSEHDLRRSLPFLVKRSVLASMSSSNPT
jgi:hypothetical protein